MINGYIKICFLLGVFLILGSCNKDEAIDYFVEPPLQEYFDRFVEEAAARNVVIDLFALQVSGDIRVISATQVIGQCLHSEKEPNTVIVDKIYWDGANDLEREFLVFHELGHCALTRDHFDVADAHGDCISIMTSGSGACRIRYNVATREALLDELFMP